MSFENGEVQESGNQSSYLSVRPVWSATQCARSDCVKRFASSSRRLMRPVKQTGWKLKPLTVSMLSMARRIIAPISWSLTPLTMVGTKIIFNPALRQFSIAASFFFEQADAARA